LNEVSSSFCRRVFLKVRERFKQPTGSLSIRDDRNRAELIEEEIQRLHNPEIPRKNPYLYKLFKEFFLAAMQAYHYIKMINRVLRET